MHESCILMHVWTTLNINDDLLKQAARLSGITEKTAVVHAGLEALVARESSKSFSRSAAHTRTISARRLHRNQTDSRCSGQKLSKNQKNRSIQVLFCPYSLGISLPATILR